jgi:hypothetical protein
MKYRFFWIGKKPKGRKIIGLVRISGTAGTITRDMQFRNYELHATGKKIKSLIDIGSNNEVTMGEIESFIEAAIKNGYKKIDQTLDDYSDLEESVDAARIIGALKGYPLVE